MTEPSELPPRTSPDLNLGSLIKDDVRIFFEPVLVVGRVLGHLLRPQAKSRDKNGAKIG